MRFCPAQLPQQLTADLPTGTDHATNAHDMSMSQTQGVAPAQLTSHVVRSCYAPGTANTVSSDIPLNTIRAQCLGSLGLLTPSMSVSQSVPHRGSNSVDSYGAVMEHGWGFTTLLTSSHQTLHHHQSSGTQ